MSGSTSPLLCCRCKVKPGTYDQKSHDMLNLYIRDKGLQWFAIRIRSRECPCTSVRGRVVYHLASLLTRAH
jgi:hypothetical protein